jgi:hypothetical protein
MKLVNYRRGLSIPTKNKKQKQKKPLKIVTCHALIHRDPLVSHMETTF